MKHRRTLQVFNVDFDEVVKEFDISDVPHANSQMDMEIRVVEYCDMGLPHITYKWISPPWGNAIPDEKRAR